MIPFHLGGLALASTTSAGLAPTAYGPGRRNDPLLRLILCRYDTLLKQHTYAHIVLVSDPCIYLYLNVDL